ncbi:MAG: hypothetical protein ACI9EW_002136 [Cellvibrionaceae bacterium]|jgi:hypothetical protein
MDFGNIFKRGFLHTWNNKFLYVLGFLAALGGSSGGGSFNSGSSGNFNPTGIGSGSGGDIEEAFKEFGDQLGFDPTNIGAMVTSIIGAVMAVACILIIIKIVLWFVRLIAEAGMIQAVADLESGVKTNFKKAFSDGRPFMMKFFMVSLILFILPLLVVFLAFVVAGIGLVPLINGGSEISPAISLIAIPIVCLMCLLVPYGLITSLVYPIAQRGIVFKGMDAMESLKYGWELLKEKTSDILILALLFTVMGFVVGIVSAIAAVPILLGTGWPVIAAFMNGDVPSGGAFAFLGVGIFLMIIIGSLVNAVFVSFRSSAFTLAYLELEGKTIQDH